MITDINYIRENFRVEEGFGDNLINNLIAYIELNCIEAKFLDQYYLWDSDDDTEYYKQQRDLVKGIVGNLLFSNVLSSGSFVVTGFGVVVKNEEYSTNVFPNQTTPQYFSTVAFRLYEKLCEMEGEKFNISEDIMPFQIALEKLI